MPKPLIFCCFTIFSTLTIFAQGQFKVTRVDSATLLKEIKYPGKLKDAIRWTDKLGDNIVITVETGIYRNSKIKHENDGSEAELFAFHYLLNSIAQQTWKIYDFIRDCPLDLEASFIKNTLQVTDLDNDGVAEIWIMYKTVCHGDVSPDNMKVVMYQGLQKFAMRGQNKTRISKKDFAGGAYTFDKAFNDGPKAFRDFALKLWNKNIMQIWGE